MNVFKVVGEWIINGTEEAKSEIDGVTSHAESSSSKFGGILSKIGNGALKVAKVAAVGIGAVATAIGGITGKSVAMYGEFEQLTGGVETLFKDSADKVMQYAQNAYKTAGMSANEYMSTITSFSASLLQSLGGDTEKAAEIGNMAVQDMSDNANKMGTSMEMIQNSYQGFAKQNFTMLDNLKLGYGGTKEEMQRLLDDANALNAAQGKHTEYSIESMSDIINAIHDVQVEMGITGTTAAEAEKTIQGSMSATRAAWQNVLIGLADDNADLSELIDILIGNISTMASNLLPRIKIIFEKIPDLLIQVAPLLVQMIGDLFPPLLEAAIGLVAKLVQSAPQIFAGLIGFVPELARMILEVFGVSGEAFNGGIAKWQEIWTTYGQPFMDGLGQVWQKLVDGWAVIFPQLEQFWTNLWNGIKIAWDSIGKPIFDFVKNAAIDVVNMFMQYWPQISKIVSEVFDLINQAWVGILQPLLKAIGQFVNDVLLPIWQGAWNTIKSVVEIVFNALVSIWNTVLKPMLQGIIDFVSGVFSGNWSRAWDGIKNIFSSIWNAIKSVFTTILNAIWETLSTIVGNIFNTISTVFTNCYNTVVEIFSNIHDAITGKIEDAKNFVGDMIDKIKGFFDFEWSLPHLKLPHVSIEGEFSLMPPSVPTFGIEWYKKGGILENPTIFGFNPGTNSIMAGGEAGPEAVAPISELMSYVKQAVASENVGMLDVLERIVMILSDYLPMLASMQMVLDSGVLVGEVAPQMDEELGKIRERKNR